MYLKNLSFKITFCYFVFLYVCIFLLYIFFFSIYTLYTQRDEQTSMPEAGLEPVILRTKRIDTCRCNASTLWAILTGIVSRGRYILSALYMCVAQPWSEGKRNQGVTQINVKWKANTHWHRTIYSKTTPRFVMCLPFSRINCKILYFVLTKLPR